MLTAVYFCCIKEGFHEDEYYTYYSSNRTQGFYFDTEVTMDRDTYRNEYVVNPEEGFNYGLVKEVQSWDVHPPLYYWVFHTVCSFLPGVFSKWQGLSINLVCFGIGLFLLRHLVSIMGKGNSDRRAFFVCLFYGFTPAAISTVVFIRMYALLTVFVLLCAILHVRAINDYSGRKPTLIRFWLPLTVISYLGFMTQYYYFVFLFFIAAVFCLYLLFAQRDYKSVLWYCASMVVTFAAAYITYPAFPGQMFHGQRGAQATENFFDLSNTLVRTRFFFGILNEYVFGKMLPLFLVLILILLVYYFIKGNKINEIECTDEGTFRTVVRKPIREVINDNRDYFLIMISVLGYMVVTLKTSLMLGGTSLRYQSPVFGMAIYLIFAGIAGLLGIYFAKPSGMLARCSKKYGTYIVGVITLLLMVIDFTGLYFGKVQFLYKGHKNHVEFATASAENGYGAICVFDGGQDWTSCIHADEYFEYDNVLFLMQDQDADIESSLTAPGYIVYMSESADADRELSRILKALSGAGYEKHCEEDCGVYIIE